MNQPHTLDDISTPSFLMCPPFTLSNDNPNNALMEKDKSRNINYPLAFKQFTKLYNYLASKSLVYLLPHAGNFQDQSFVANLGIVLPHLLEPTVILSNFKSPPRWDEEKVGIPFFQMLKYRCDRPPYEFEGEADLKYVRDNLYFGAYPIRTVLKTHHWLEDKYDCNIIPIKMNDQKLYHLDCIVFPLSEDCALATTSSINKNDIKQIEKYVNIVDIPSEFGHSGMTNLCRIGNDILCRDVSFKDKKWMDTTMNKQGLNVVYFDLTAFDANGADLSCLIMHINRISYKSYKVTPLNQQVKNFYRSD